MIKTDQTELNFIKATQNKELIWPQNSRVGRSDDNLTKEF